MVPEMTISEQKSAAELEEGNLGKEAGWATARGWEMDMLRHTEETGGISRTLCERCLLGLCISLLGEWRDEEELFFSVFWK